MFTFVYEWYNTCCQFERVSLHYYVKCCIIYYRDIVAVFLKSGMDSKTILKPLTRALLLTKDIMMCSPSPDQSFLYLKHNS